MLFLQAEESLAEEVGQERTQYHPSASHLKQDTVVLLLADDFDARGMFMVWLSGLGVMSCS